MAESGNPITRREAAQMVAAAAISTSYAAPQQLSFALIGCGARGQHLVEHLNRAAGGRCSAVCDWHEPSAQKAARASRDKPQVVRDYRTLLNRGDLQAVLVATPPHTHASILKDAIKAGKHIFCEPVLANKPDDLKAIAELAESRDIVIQMGFQRRYSRFYQTARQMASKGFLGEVTHIQTQWHRNPGPATDPQRPRETNWRFLREFSYGMLSEVVAHHMDLADWFFNDRPEYVMGVGGLDWRRDGRDVQDNFTLLFRYPDGRQLTASALCTNKHLSLFGGSRSEKGEMILGTEGTIEITLGTDEEPPLAMWYYEPSPKKVGSAEDAREIARVAGATFSSRGRGYRAMPILLERDQIKGDESFFNRELKYARRWLYARGVMVPEEEQHPVAAQLESFFECCREGNRPKADLKTGRDNAESVILAQNALDERRRVDYHDSRDTNDSGKGA